MSVLRHPADSLDVRRQRARYLSMMQRRSKRDTDIAMESVRNLGQIFVAEEDNPEFNVNTFVSVL